MRRQQRSYLQVHKTTMSSPLLKIPPYSIEAKRPVYLRMCHHPAPSTRRERQKSCSRSTKLWLRGRQCLAKLNFKWNFTQFTLAVANCLLRLGIFAVSFPSGKLFLFVMEAMDPARLTIFLVLMDIYKLIKFVGRNQISKQLTLSCRRSCGNSTGSGLFYPGWIWRRRISIWDRSVCWCVQYHTTRLTSESDIDALWNC